MRYDSWADIDFDSAGPEFDAVQARGEGGDPLVRSAPIVTTAPSRSDPEEAGIVYADRIAEAVSAAAWASPAVILHGIQAKRDIPRPDRDRKWWRTFVDVAVTRLVGAGVKLDAAYIDHARYPSRRQPEEREWQTETFVEPFEEVAEVVSMYGTPSGPTFWRWAMDKPSETIDEVAEARAAWVIMPNQWRPRGGPVEYVEVVHALTVILRFGIERVLLWSDPKTTNAAVWALTLRAICAAHGYPVEAYKPPASLPPAMWRPGETLREWLARQASLPVGGEPE